MEFLKAYLRNIFILVLILAGMVIFLLIFYPGVLTIYSEMIKVYSVLKLWPILILGLLVMIMPRLRRK